MHELVDNNMTLSVEMHITLYSYGTLDKVNKHCSLFPISPILETVGIFRYEPIYLEFYSGAWPGLKSGEYKGKILVHALYFSEDLLLPPPHTYFLIDFTEIYSTILAKVRWAFPPPPISPCPRRWLNSSYNQKLKIEASLYQGHRARVGTYGSIDVCIWLSSSQKSLTGQFFIRYFVV